MAVSHPGQSSLVHSLATLLRNDGMWQCDDALTLTCLCVFIINIKYNAEFCSLLRLQFLYTSPFQFCSFYMENYSVLSPAGDLVLEGSSTLTLPAASLQQLTRLFEQYLLSRSQQHGFLALPSHPADTDSLLQLQFLFDILQKTISLKVCLASKNWVKLSLCDILFDCSVSFLLNWSTDVWDLMCF